MLAQESSFDKRRRLEKILPVGIWERECPEASQDPQIPIEPIGPYREGEEVRGAGLGRHTPHNHPSHQRRPRAPASFKDLRMEEARRWKKPGGSQGSSPTSRRSPRHFPGNPFLPSGLPDPFGLGRAGFPSRPEEVRARPLRPQTPKDLFPANGTATSLHGQSSPVNRAVG